jgi:hypothetical protein
MKWKKRNNEKYGEIRDPRISRHLSPPLSFFRSKCAVGIGREENRQGGGRHDDGPFFFYNNHFFFVFLSVCLSTLDLSSYP